MRLAILTLLLLSDFGQRQVACADEPAKKNGIVKVFSAGGIPEREESFRNGELDGPCKYYSSSGRLKEFIEYAKGRRHGKFRQFGFNGKLTFEALYRDGDIAPDGYEKTYDPPGTLKREKTYAQGKLSREIAYFETKKEEKISEFINGEIAREKFFHPNGRPAELISYQNGQKHGIYQKWNSAGALIEKSNFEKGIRVGVYEQFADSGKPRMRASYRDGHKDGEEITFYETGATQSQVQWKVGQRQGPALFQYQSGKPLCRGAYAANRRDGQWECWRSSGTRLWTGHYAHGGPVKITFFDANEKVVQRLDSSEEISLEIP